MRITRAFSWLTAATVCGFMLAGCEKDRDTDVGNYFDDNPYASDPRVPEVPSDVYLTPSAAAISNVGAKIAFQAAGGEAPYRWELANGANGSLTVQGGSQAVYTSLKVEPNAVFVYDHRNHVGVAYVNINVPALTASANPIQLSVNGTMSMLTAAGGTPPYNWTVVDAALGHIVGSDSDPTAVYIRDNVGDNAVTVEDSAGRRANVIIKQP